MTDIEYLKKYLAPEKLEEGFKMLKEGLPLQYIIGNVNFCGYTIKVNPNVLIPRFETELLVEKTINYIKENFKKPISIIDLGTGSGAIAISLKKALDCQMTAVDISSKALELALENAQDNEAEIKFIESDMLDQITEKYDVIISNPPYIGYGEEIDDKVRHHEPAIALFAENNGLEFYEKILSQAINNLKENALIAFEIGKDQGQAIKEMALKYFPQAMVKIEKDLPGLDRYVFIFIKNT